MAHTIRRPKDPTQVAVIVCKMATGQVPNDKADVLGTAGNLGTTAVYEVERISN